MKARLSTQGLLALFIIVLSAIASFVACKKQLRASPEELQPITGSDKTVIDAKSYFLHSILKSEDDQIVNKVKLDAKGMRTPKLPTRFGKISGIIDWNAGFVTVINGTNYLFVPLKEDIKPFKNKDYEFFRYLIFYQNVAGVQDLSVIEILGDPKTTLGDEHAKTAIGAWANKLLNSTNAIGAVNASIIFYTKEYQRESSFHVDNGVWSEKRISFRSDLEIRLRDSQ